MKTIITLLLLAVISFYSVPSALPPPELVEGRDGIALQQKLTEEKNLASIIRNNYCLLDEELTRIEKKQLTKK